jgi:hypothetical protein
MSGRVHYRAALFAYMLSGCAFADGVGFNRDVKPILSDKCFACHGPDATDAKGDLQLHSLDAAKEVIVPGNRAASELWKRISSTDPDEVMPPLESHHVLSAEQIETLGKWIDGGAKYEGHWAFQPVVATDEGTIDGFVRAELARVGVTASPRADAAALRRRLKQDLTGLPPTLEEIAANEPFEVMVDRLLASPAAAERLAVDWLDGARYADTNGYSIDDHRDMWLWRDWVIHAFLTNKRFDEFTLEQLAGDLLPESTDQEKVATGFLRNSMNTHEGGTIAEEYRVTYTADKVDTVSTVFMGLTMKCSQCHDHKYDPITQKEYYQFYAFFNTSSEPGSGANNANTAPMVEAGSLICSKERVMADARKRLAELQQLRVAPETGIATLRDAWERTISSTGDFSLFPDEGPIWIWDAEKNTSAAANFRREFSLSKVPPTAKIWVSCDDACKVTVNGSLVGETTLWMEPKVFDVNLLKQGKNLIEVSAKNDEGTPAGLLLSLAMRQADGTTAYIVTDKSWQPGVEIAPHGKGPWKMLYGKSELQSAVATVGNARSEAQWKLINDAFGETSEKAKIYFHQLDLEEGVLKNASENGRSTVMVMDYKERKTHVLDRGAYDQPREEVFAGTPMVLPAMGDGEKSRLDLAKWLIDPKHPLTSRVIVNRYWQMIFGTGLVKTSENFGSQGEYPSHPELLDWLAADFVKHGWDVRRLLKQMVMSETYQQTSVVTAELLERDPYNRLLARAPRVRLAAEFVRDSALAASGLLNMDVGGPSVYPYQPERLWEEVSHYGYPAGFTAQKYFGSMGSANYRRSMYTAWKRTSPPPSMAIFDAPSRETCTIRRLNTNTPLQALVLQNDPQFLEAARVLGEKMAAADNGVALGFARVLGRQATAVELRIFNAALARYKMNNPEMAWTLVASTLLNMDEAMTKQ